MGRIHRAAWLLALPLLVVGAGCGEREAKEEKEESPEAAEAEKALTPFELENGIGPVKEKIEVGAVNPSLVTQGEAVFETKCSMCHKMDSVYVGPALREVTARRTPAFILNMILNPQEMVERHPIAKQLLAERMSFMPNQQVTQDDARAVLEYLRTQAKGAPKQ